MTKKAPSAVFHSPALGLFPFHGIGYPSVPTPAPTNSNGKEIPKGQKDGGIKIIRFLGHPSPSWFPWRKGGIEKNRIKRTGKPKHKKENTMKPYAEIKTATKDLVDALLSMNTTNRNLKKSVVERYKRDISNGKWMLTNQGIGVSENGILIDGQHRLHALKDCGYPPVQLLVVYGLPMESQSVVDQQAKRSARDLLMFAFDARVSRTAPAIGNCILKNRMEWKGGYTPTISELMECLNDHSFEIDQIVNTPKAGQFFAAPFLAAFVIAAKSGYLQEVKKFMEEVETGEMLTKQMPAFHLRNLIITSKKGSGGSQVQIERFRKTIRAIHAFIAGETMGVLRAS